VEAELLEGKTVLEALLYGSDPNGPPIDNLIHSLTRALPFYDYVTIAKIAAMADLTRGFTI
jgi:hypothetical protein